jgi:hypothetical protein
MLSFGVGCSCCGSYFADIEGFSGSIFDEIHSPYFLEKRRVVRNKEDFHEKRYRQQGQPAGPGQALAQCDGPPRGKIDVVPLITWQRAGRPRILRRILLN